MMSVLEYAQDMNKSVEEIIKKMDEDDYYDEAIDTLIDKKDTVYNSEPKPVKQKKKNKKIKGFDCSREQ